MMTKAELQEKQKQQLKEAYERLTQSTPAEVRKNVYKSLTYSWLYAPPPDGFTMAIHYGEEYVNNPRLLPSGGIWANLACAYAQRAKWLMTEGGADAPDPKLRQSVMDAIRQALRQDDSWSLLFQKLLKGDSGKSDGDLQIFKDDGEMRELIGLPARRIINPDPAPKDAPSGVKAGG